MRHVLRRSVQLMKFASFLGAAVALPTAASAKGLVLLLPHLAAAVSFTITPSSQCVTYVYDKNGNRTAVTVSSITTSGAQWGAGTYGCFVWHS